MILPVRAASIWLAGWDKRIKITLDHDDIDTDLSHFPILLYLSGSSGIDGDDVTPIFDEVGADSKKIAVTKSDGTTELYVEIEKWNATSEEAWLWVSGSGWSISSSSDTELYIYYDSDHSDNTDYVGTAGSVAGEGVWDSNFKFVTHMGNATFYNAITFNQNITDAFPTGDRPHAQGVAVDGDYLYASNDDTIKKTYKASPDFASPLAANDHADTDGHTIDQINALFIEGDYIYCTARNLDPNPDKCYIRKFKKSDLSFVEDIDVESEIPDFGKNNEEGCTHAHGFWWIVYYGNGNNKVSQFDEDWNHVADHDITHDYNQGGFWIDDYFYVSSGAGVSYYDVYKWTGSSFVFLRSIADIAEAEGNQGIWIDETDDVLWVASVRTENVTKHNDVVKIDLKKDTTIFDSTSNNNVGVKKAATEPQAITSGNVSDAQDFDGSDDYVSCSDDTSLQLGASGTVECWVNCSIKTGNRGFVCKDGGGYHDDMALGINMHGQVSEEIVFAFNRDPEGDIPYLNTTFNTNEWVYVVGSWDSNGMVLYKNGLQADSNSIVCEMTAATYPLYVGRHDVATRILNGTEDEVRLSNAKRSATWISATYETCRDHLVTFGYEQSKQSVSTTNMYLWSETGSSLSTVSYTSNVLSFTVTDSTGITSTTNLYCTLETGKPDKLFIDDNEYTEGNYWTYDGSNNILTVTWTHSSSAGVKVKWKGSGLGLFNLFVHVTKDGKPTHATLNVEGINYTAFALRKFELPYGIYEITCHCDDEIQTKEVGLFSHSHVGFNFASPKHGKGPPWTVITLPIIVVLGGCVIFLLGKKK